MLVSDFTLKKVSSCQHHGDVWGLPNSIETGIYLLKATYGSLKSADWLLCPISLTTRGSIIVQMRLRDD